MIVKPCSGHMRLEDTSWLMYRSATGPPGCLSWYSLQDHTASLTMFLYSSLQPEKPIASWFHVVLSRMWNGDAAAGVVDKKALLLV